MERKLVVYTDPFYPATLRHLEALRLAVSACGADGGLFAPVTYEAARRVSGERERCRLMTDRARLELLAALTAVDPALGVETELMQGREERVSLRRLGRLRLKHPEARLVLTLTLQQLYILGKRPERDTLAERFDFAVLCREGDDAERAFERSEWLAAHRSAFTVVNAPDFPDETEQRRVREWVFAGDEATGEALGAAGLNVLRAHGYFGCRRVDRFRGEYHFLSNFYAAALDFDGLHYLNSEAAYQAQKCCSDAERERFTALQPLEAKVLGRTVLLREDWDDVCVGLMARVLRAKFEQNPELAALLLATGDAVLVEANTWGDLFWGADARTGEGENHLGRLLMALREELAQEAE